jgi:hypothetical protein
MACPVALQFQLRVSPNGSQPAAMILSVKVDAPWQRVCVVRRKAPWASLVVVAESNDVETTAPAMRLLARAPGEGSTGPGGQQLSL